MTERHNKRTYGRGMRMIPVLGLLILAALFLPGSVRADQDETAVTVDNGIPVVYLMIDESRGSVQEMLESPDHSFSCYGTFSIDVPEGFHYSDFPDSPCESIEGLSMSIRGRGNSTWKKSMKKPYKIKLDKKTDVLGLGSNKHWVLIANISDETLIRDRITAWIGDEMGFSFTPRGVPVDVVMTGSEYGSHYLGSYYLSENVRVGENRLEIEELKESDTDPSVITGGYLLQNATQLRDGSPDRFYTKRGVDWATETPSFDTESGALRSSSKDDETDEEESPGGGILGDAYENHAQQDYIQQYIRDFEDVLFEGGTAYRELMDVESAAKYWLINIFTLNNDAYHTGSTYIYKDRDPEGGISKLYWGPLWDFDYAWNYVSWTDGIEYGHEWMKPLFYDRGEGGFIEELHRQWPVLRSLIMELVEDGGVIDRYYEETKASAAEDRQIWKAGYDNTYLDEINDLKAWIRTRLAWFDENFDMVDSLIHKVTFLADGETWQSDFVTDGSELALEDFCPEKEGFTFLGWTDMDGRDAEPFVTVTEDLSFTAKFVSDSEITHAEDVAFARDSDIIPRNMMVPAYQIEYEVIPADAFDRKISWSSSDEGFATVDDEGKVRYKGTGEATFTAELRNGKKRTFSLTVTDGDLPAAGSISPEISKIKLTVGEQSPCVIHTDPSPAQISSIEYKPENENVVTVGDCGVLTAAGPGRTKVQIMASVSGEDGEKILKTTVTVIVSRGKGKMLSAPAEKSTGWIWIALAGLLAAAACVITIAALRKQSAGKKEK